MTEFTEWLQSVLDDKGLSKTTLTREAGLGKSTIYNVLNGHQKPGYFFCQAIAGPLDVDIDFVLEKAGLSARPEYKTGGDVIEGEIELVHVYRQLDEQGQAEAIKIIKMLRETHPKYAPKKGG